jgi:NAD(P)-dependent dehydrogenase (short-subunit alcohol dehydrogenase family)
MPVAIVTGGSKGLGRALAAGLAERCWSIVSDARDAEDLGDAERELQSVLGDRGSVITIPGDVTYSAHRRELIRAAQNMGALDLLVNNASTLGTTPLPPLGRYEIDQLRRVFEVNAIAPLALVQDALTLLLRSANPRVLDVTSDVSVEPYQGWGAYGSSKAALDHLGAVLALEQPSLRVWTVDPGDMRTQMHQDAFPGEDISDLPPPESVVPALIRLVEGNAPSGRYRASDLAINGVEASSVR